MYTNMVPFSVKVRTFVLGIKNEIKNTEILQAVFEIFFLTGFIKINWILCTALFAARSSMKIVESFGRGGLFCRLDGM